MSQIQEHLDTEVAAIEQIGTKARLPSMYKVLLHNDNYTSQEFVILVLQVVFHKSEAEATQIMLAIHHGGVGVAGIYPYEIAETKRNKVLGLAKQYEYPLQCSLEQE